MRPILQGRLCVCSCSHRKQQTMRMKKRFLLQAVLALGVVQARVMPGGNFNSFAMHSRRAGMDSSRARQGFMRLARQKKRQVHFELRGGASTSSSSNTASSQVQDSGSATLLGVAPSFVTRVLLLAASPQVARLVFAYSQGGFKELTTNGAIPESWQAAFASVWAISLIAVAVPGRYDGLRDTDPVPLTERTANLFVPSGWAFAIWGPIFLGETLMMLRLTGAGLKGSEGLAMELGRLMAPGWCAGTLAQVLWCVAFRPSVCGPKQLWVPSLLLGATALGLGASHRALRDYSKSLPTGLNLMVRWPLVLHFGWVTAAALVNFNNWLALRGTNVVGKETAVYASVGAALGVAGYVWDDAGDIGVVAVVCWALSAVASNGAKSAKGVVNARVLKRVRAVVTGGAGVAGLGLVAKLARHVFELVLYRDLSRVI